MRGKQQQQRLERLGQRIKDLRYGREWSQEELAYRARQSTRNISEIETGKTNAGINAFILIARAFRVDVAELLRGISIDSRERVYTMPQTDLERLDAALRIVDRLKKSHAQRKKSR